MAHLFSVVPANDTNGIDKFVPKKTISSKPFLLWMTQEIQRNIRRTRKTEPLKTGRFYPNEAQGKAQAKSCPQPII